MSRDHAKREIVIGDKPTGSGKTPSRESDNKYKEESSSSIKLHRRGDKKKKKMKHPPHPAPSSGRDRLFNTLHIRHRVVHYF
jgi:hypothetical protein